MDSEVQRSDSTCTCAADLQGKVLEISAGTGRNIPYYPYENITSLTLSDLSKPMLERSETKYFDELGMINKHQETKISFQCSDAHCMSMAPTSPPVQTRSVHRRVSLNGQDTVAL